MTNELKQLYSGLRGNISQETIKDIENKLMGMYSDLSILPSLFSLINPSEESFFRKHAAIAIKNIIPKRYDEINGNPEIRPMILAILSQEDDIQIRHFLLEAIRPFFSDGIQLWEGMPDFLNSLLASNDPNKIELYLSIYAEAIGFLPAFYFGEQYENFCVQVQHALADNDPSIIIAGSQLLSSMFNQSSTSIERTLQLYHFHLSALFNALTKSATNRFPGLSTLLDNHCSLIRSLSIDDSQNIGPSLFGEFFNFIQQTPEMQANPSLCCLLSEPICSLIDRFPYSIASGTQGHGTSTTETVPLPLILSLIFTVSTQSYEDGSSFIEQTDMVLISTILEALSKVLPPDEFFQMFWQIKRTDSPQAIIATSIGLISFLERIPETIADNFDEILGFIFECFKSNASPIVEAGFHIINELLIRNADLFSPNSTLENIIGAIFSGISSGYYPLIQISLNILAKILYSPFTNSSITPEMASTIAHHLVLLLNILSSISRGQVSPELSAEKITSVITSNNFNDFLSLVLVSVASLARAAGDLPQINEPLFPVISTILTSEGMPYGHGYAAEALSFMIKGTPDQMSENFGQYFSFFMHLVSSDDPCMISSGMIAISNVSHIPQFGPMITEALQALVPIISGPIQQLKIIADADQSPDAVFESNSEINVETQKRSLQLISSLAKNLPQLIQPHVPPLMEMSIVSLQCSLISTSSLCDPILQRYGVKAIVYLSRLVANEKGIPDQAFHILEALAHSKSSESASIAFIGLAKLIHFNLLPPIKEGQLAIAITLALRVASHSLECQEKESNEYYGGDDEGEGEFDDDITENIDDNDFQQETSSVFSEAFGLLAEVAQFQPEQFPIAKLFDLISVATKLAANGDSEELIEYVGVFTEYCAVAFASFPEIYKSNTLQLMTNSLQLINCINPPYPLAGFRVLLEKNVIQPVQNDGRIDFPGNPIEICQNVLNSENNGQPYYWDTVAAATSFMFSLFIQNKDFFGIYGSSLLGKMLSVVPNCLNESECENILSSILQLSQDPQISGEFGQEMQRAIGQTLQLRKNKWNKLKIRNELTEEMKQFFKA